MEAGERQREHVLSLTSFRQLQDRLHTVAIGRTVTSILRFELECARKGVDSLPILLNCIAESYEAHGLPPNHLAVSKSYSACLLINCPEAEALSFARLVRSRLQAEHYRSDTPQLRFNVGIAALNAMARSGSGALALAKSACGEARSHGNFRIAIIRA